MSSATFYIGRDKYGYKFFKSTLKAAPKLSTHIDAMKRRHPYKDWNRSYEFSLCTDGFKRHFGDNILKVGEIKRITVTFGAELPTVAK